MNDRERLAALEKTKADYEAQLLQWQARDKAARKRYGQPRAWLVQCPAGHDFDEMVFAEREEAEHQADCFREMNEGDDPDPAITPLYAVPTEEVSAMTRVAEMEAELLAAHRNGKEAWEAAAKEQDRVKELEAQAAATREALEMLTAFHCQPYMPFAKRYGQGPTIAALDAALEKSRSALSASDAGRDLLAELERLREIVGRLWTTADGVPIAPRSRVWIDWKDGASWHTVSMVLPKDSRWTAFYIDDNDPSCTDHVAVNEMGIVWSSPEAAEAAKAKGERR